MALSVIEIFDIVVTVEALGMMIIVMFMLWYNDVYTKRTSLAKRIDIFTRYKWFKLSSSLMFCYVLFEFISYLIKLRIGASLVSDIFSVIGSISLFLLGYTLFKVSSVTYGSKPEMQQN
jgi:hypothetical protein